MPTTCGFPNCKFRSRYRGHQDNRHFYRIPKKPSALRERWLQAIGRTESTIVNQQLRICSGHFHGGRKSEGDIPVSDPDVDSPIRMDLSTLSVAKRTDKCSNGSNGLVTVTASAVSRCRREALGKLAQLGASGARSNRKHHHSNHHHPYHHQTGSFSSVSSPNSSSSGSSNRAMSAGSGAAFNISETESTKSFSEYQTPAGCAVPVTSRPLVTLLDGRDCSVEMPLLTDIAQVAFCDADAATDIHDRVYKEAVAVMLYGTLSLSRDDLSKFKLLKHVVLLGTGYDSLDIKAAGELGIAVSHVRSCCVEEVADSTLCLILNLYRRTIWLAREAASGKKIASMEEMSTVASGSVRIRGETLGIVGFGWIGQAVALRAKAFGFNTIFYDPFVCDGIEKSFGVTRVYTLEELLYQCDCVTLHCSVNEHNRHMINSCTIQQMRHGVYIVNTAHGSLVDEKALATALKDGRVRGAALDVWENEQIPFADSPLNGCPNVICTPHCAYFSDQSVTELREVAAREIRCGLIGSIPENLRHCINKECLAKAAILGSSSCLSAEEASVDVKQTDDGTTAPVDCSMATAVKAQLPGS